MTKLAQLNDCHSCNDALSVIFDMSSNILSDISFDILSDLSCNMSSETLSDICQNFNISSDILCGSFNSLFHISFCIFSNISSNILSDIFLTFF